MPPRLSRPHRFGTGHILPAAIAVCLLVDPAFATGSPAQLCEQAAEIAARETGVPLAVLRAVALTETGRARSGQGLSPWPWVTNEGGNASWFDSVDEAAAHTQLALQSGVTNIDLGCFQLNHRWHSAAFASVADMLDPVSNARYAAHLLVGHFRDLGDWSLAAGAYHSATPENAERYRARFDAVYASLGNGPPDDTSAFDLASVQSGPARINLFPLFQVGGRGSGGSLFPGAPGRPRLIGD